MKDQNLKSIIETLVCLLVYLMISLVVMIGCTGCTNTSPQSIAYRAEGSTILTVDSAMRAWADYVSQGLATSNQVETVHQAYDKYYAVQLGAKATVDAWIAAKTPSNSNEVTQITEAVQASAQALIGIVQQFTAKKGSK